MPAAANAPKETFIRVWPRPIRPPKGSVQICVDGKRKPVILLRNQSFSPMALKSCASTVWPFAALVAEASVVGMPLGGFEPSAVVDVSSNACI